VKEDKLFSVLKNPRLRLVNIFFSAFSAVSAVKKAVKSVVKNQLTFYFVHYVPSCEAERSPAQRGGNIKFLCVLRVALRSPSWGGLRGEALSVLLS
jgi:hypothetical protein